MSLEVDENEKANENTTERALALIRPVSSVLYLFDRIAEIYKRSEETSVTTIKTRITKNRRY